MSQKLALIIGNSEYEDPNLTRLVTPNADVNALVEVLRDPEISHFDEVTPLINQPADTIRRAIARFFAKKMREDLLLLYFSGHGVLDDQGHLYLAVKDTENDLLSGTAIPAAFITSQMDHSRSQRQVLILDCCHSGAFARGAKGTMGASVGTKSAFEGTGYGRVVLTASDSTQFAWEGDQVIGDAENSVFTHYLVQGLRTGEADTEADGQITIDKLYDYVYEQVVSKTPKQKPGKWSYKQQGEIVIARNPYPVVKPAELPVELQQAIESPFAGVREGAVKELDRLLRGSDKGLVLVAHEALKQMLDDDSRRVSEAATESLTTYEEARSISAEPEAEIEPLATDSAEPEQPRPEAENEKADFERLEKEEKIRPEHKITEITPERREIEKGKRTKRLSLRTKMLLLAALMSVAAGVAWWAYDAANERQARITLARSLVNYALQDNDQNKRERAALLARQAAMLNEHFDGDLDGQIENALHTIFRTSAIVEGLGHAATGAELIDLVCQNVNIKQVLDPAEWEQFVGKDIAHGPACPQLLDTQRLQLRSERMTTTDMEALSLNLRQDSGYGYPIEDITNNFGPPQGDVVVDHATGLMWQKSGSDETLKYEEAQDYIDKLNGRGFAGHNDWRLPTVEELMSLLEPKKQPNDLYINPIFEKQAWCWSADRSSSGAPWNVDFNKGYVRLTPIDDSKTWKGWVRAVRSL